MFGSSMNPRQRMALAIKAKQKASNPMGTAPAAPSAAPSAPSPQGLGMPAPVSLNVAAPMNKPQPPVFSQGASELNPKFFHLKKKLAKF